MFVLFILGFRYNLGFYGSTYQMNAATDKEKHADSFLIENRHQFWWFPPHDLTIFLSIKKIVLFQAFDIILAFLEAPIK